MVGSMFMAMVGAELLYDHVCEKLREFFNCQEPLPDIERLHPAELVGSFARYKWFDLPTSQYTSCSDPLRIEIYFGNLMAGPFWQPFIWNIRAGKMGLVKSFNSKHYITLNSNLQWHLFIQQNYSLWLLMTTESIMCWRGSVRQSLKLWSDFDDFYSNSIIFMMVPWPFSQWDVVGGVAPSNHKISTNRKRAAPLVQFTAFLRPKDIGKIYIFSAKKSILIRPIRGEQKIEQNISTK